MNDKNDQSPSQDTLLLEKLNLEVRLLRDRVGLEEKKLKLDIDNLRAAFRRTLIVAVLSASVPMTIAVAGWTIQRLAEQRAAKRTEDYHREDLYNRMIENLGSANPSLRLAAVVGLSEYAQPGGQIGERHTSDEVINALTSRLANEDDGAVQQQIFLTMGSLGKAVLPQVANTNRRAAAQFVRDSGELAGLLLLKNSIAKSDNSSSKLKKIISDDLPARLKSVSLVLELSKEQSKTKTKPDKEQTLSADERESARGKRYSSSGLIHLMGLYRGDSLRSQTFLSQIELVKLTNPTQLDAAIIAADATFRRSAGFLLLTNFALEQILRSSSGQLRGETLDSIVIIWASLNKLNLEGLSLRNSYIRADLSGARLDFCDFSDSILIDMRVAGAQFRGATLSRTTLPAELGWLDDDFPDLTGANWWDNSKEIENDEPKPANLEGSFPRAVQEEQRKKLLEAWKIKQ
jgi:uncharacterized protein YjbI with pentapeptide repeats